MQKSNAANENRYRPDRLFIGVSGIIVRFPGLHMLCFPPSIVGLSICCMVHAWRDSALSLPTNGVGLVSRGAGFIPSYHRRCLRLDWSVIATPGIHQERESELPLNILFILVYFSSGFFSIVRRRGLWTNERDHGIQTRQTDLYAGNNIFSETNGWMR